MSRRPRLGEYFENRQEPGREGLPTLSVTMNDGLVHRDELERRTETTLLPDQHLLVRRGDIAYNMMRMWQGACGLANVDGLVSPAYVVLRPKENIDSRFAYHWFKSDRMTYLLWAYSHGLTEDRLRLYFDDFAEIPIEPPSLDQQQRIVAVLDAWGRAIEHTERLIAAKERQKNYILGTLFGPERNALKTKGIALGDIASIHYGKALAADRYVENAAVSIFGSQGVIGQTEDRLFEGPAIVVGRKGTIDKPILIESGAPIWAIDTTFVLKTTISTRLIHAFLDYIELKMLSETSGIPSLSSDNLRALRIPASVFNDVSTADSLITAVDAEIQRKNEILSCLIIQKRGLLQKLLIGSWQLDERFDPVPARQGLLAGAST